MTQQQKIEMDYLVDDLTQDIAKMLMQDQQCDIAEALNIVYNSRTYSALENPATGLFYQSAVYLYDLLLEELTLTKLTTNNALAHNVSPADTQRALGADNASEM